mgnify:CR=1 FL=1
MNKLKIRDSIRFLGAACFFWLYIPHFIAFMVVGGVKGR